MSYHDLKILNFLCEQVGIKTAMDLEQFKKKTQATNENLLRKLALYFAFEMKWSD